MRFFSIFFSFRYRGSCLVVFVAVVAAIVAVVVVVVVVHILVILHVVVAVVVQSFPYVSSQYSAVSNENLNVN